MALNSSSETNENQESKTIEDYITQISEYSQEDIIDYINEAMIYSSSLTTAFQSVDDLSVTELQSNLVIEKLRLTIECLESWIKLHHNNSSESFANKHNDEL